MEMVIVHPQLTSFKKIICIILLVLSSPASHSFSKGSYVNPKSIRKTIKGENGKTIDCVDIYHQPTFSHPLLKNHTIQMKPTSYPRDDRLINMTSRSPNSTSSSGLVRIHHCPEGTIPILRSQMAFPQHRKFPLSDDNNNITAEFGIAVYPRGNYYGATGNLNVWSPTTFGKEFSLAQVWVTDGEGPDYNSVEAGWIVRTSTSNTSEPTLFISWTSDGYGSTGCYNLDCPGFVQTSQEVTLGEVLTPVSTYDGPQYQVYISIHKDIRTGNWWLNFQGKTVGYWPRYIFSGLRASATVIAWGGSIGNSHPQGSHTATQMGSGHFADEGRGRAAFVDNLGFVDEGEHVKDAQKPSAYATNSACYSVTVGDWNELERTHFYYGGPGFSPNCKQ